MVNKKCIATILCCLVFPCALFSCGSMTRAATRGDIEGVKSFLDKGENINGYDKWGWTPVMWAIYYNQYDLVKWMLARGADANARTQKDYGSIMKDSTPMIIAAAYGYGGIVRMLLNYKGDPRARDRAGESVESIADKNSFMDILILVRGGGRGGYATDPSIVERTYDRKEAESEEGNQVFFMNDGSKVVGKIVSQDNSRVTVRSAGRNIVLDKDNILHSSIPYQQYER